MRIGIPREIKPQEGRVALVPAAAAELVREGHEVAIERSAGAASGHADADYAAAGVRILPDAPSLYGASELIVKVKEPVGAELDYLRADHLLFSFLHLAANLELMQRLRAIGLTAIGFETVETADGRLPLLAPMSDIAGRLATQIGATLLHAPTGGKGLLLGGLPAAERGRVVIVGAGVAGGNAARVAAELGAGVIVFDRKPERLEAMRALGANVTALYPFTDAVAAEVAAADLLIGAVLIPASRAPHVVGRDMIRAMPPGGVVIDISIDQGGCIETMRPTDWDAPTFVDEDVIHFGVTNMPAAVPRSASQALSATLLPWLQRLARKDWRDDPALARGINVAGGDIVHPVLRQYMA